MRDARFIEHVSRTAASVVVELTIQDVPRSYDDHLVVVGDAKTAVWAPRIVIGVRGGRAYERGVYH